MYNNIECEFTSIEDLPEFIEDFCDHPQTEKELDKISLMKNTSISSMQTACSTIDLDDLFFLKPRAATKTLPGLVRILKQFRRVGKTCPVKTQNFLSQLSRSFARMFMDCKKLIQGTKSIVDILSCRGLYKFSIANIEKVNIAKGLFAEYFEKSSEINTIFKSVN